MLLEDKLFFVLKLSLLLLELFLPIKLSQLFLLLFYYLLRLLLLLVFNPIKLSLFKAIFDGLQLFFMVVHLDLFLGLELLFLFVISQLNIELVVFLNIFMVSQDLFESENVFLSNLYLVIILLFLDNLGPIQDLVVSTVCQLSHQSFSFQSVLLQSMRTGLFHLE